MVGKICLINIIKKADLIDDYIDKIYDKNRVKVE